MAVKKIRDGFSTLTPYLVVDGAEKAIEFYQKAFGAELVDKAMGADGKVMNAQLKIGNCMLMLNDEFPDYGAVGPKKIGGSAVTIHLSVEDVDAMWKRATDAGVEVTMELADMFWGDRYGSFTDPFGHKWSMATHIADPTPEEMEKAMAAFA
jgi:PhnB protein